MDNSNSLFYTEYIFHVMSEDEFTLFFLMMSVDTTFTVTV